MPRAAPPPDLLLLALLLLPAACGTDDARTADFGERAHGSAESVSDHERRAAQAQLMEDKLDDAVDDLDERREDAAGDEEDDAEAP